MPCALRFRKNASAAAKHCTCECLTAPFGPGRQKHNSIKIKLSTFPRQERAPLRQQPARNINTSSNCCGWSNTQRKNCMFCVWSSSACFKHCILTKGRIVHTFLAKALATLTWHHIFQRCSLSPEHDQDNLLQPQRLPP